MDEGGLVEINVSCNLGAGQLSYCVPLYVSCITMQASIRISIPPLSVPFGRRRGELSPFPLLTASVTAPSQQAGVPAATRGANMPIPHTVI